MNWDFGKIVSLQILRAVAALLVVNEHVCNAINEIRPDALNSFIHGVFGVQIFFVISGFIMYFVAGERFGTARATLDFLSNRIKRVVPLYWFYTTLWIAAALLVPSALSNYDVNLSHVMASYFFIPFARATDGHVQPVLALGWTLNYEMYFYLVFSLALMFSRRTGIILFLVFFALTSAMWILPVAQPFKFWMSPIILEFAAGICIGILFRHTRTFELFSGRYWFLVVLALLVLVGVFNIGDPSSNSPWENLFSGVAAIAIVLFAAFQTTESRKLPLRALNALGDASYSLYLSHPFAVQAAILILVTGNVFDDVSSQVLYGTLVGISVCTGLLSYHLLEKPMGGLLRRKSPSSPALKPHGAN